MKNLIWRLRNGIAKTRYIAETFGAKALVNTVWRKLKEKAHAGPTLPPSSHSGFILFPVPGPVRRLTFIVETLDTVTPELGEAVDLCQSTGRALRIVTRARPARADVFGSFIKSNHPDFRANVDFTFVDRANPYAELPVGNDDLFWPGESAREAIPAGLLFQRGVHVSV